MLFRLLIVILAITLPSSLMARNKKDECKSTHFTSAGLTQQQAYAFLTKLQHIIRQPKPREQLAQLIRYPIVKSGCHCRYCPRYQKPFDHEKCCQGCQIYNNPQEILNHLSEIITPKVTQAVLDQRACRLFANYQGVRVGHGEIWFSLICHRKETMSACRKRGEIKIIHINHL